MKTFWTASSLKVLFIYIVDLVWLNFSVIVTEEVLDYRVSQVG